MEIIFRVSGTRWNHFWGEIFIKLSIGNFWATTWYWGEKTPHLGLGPSIGPKLYV